MRRFAGYNRDVALIEPSPAGLFCPPGNFYIDPHRSADIAVTTHAHTDHARPGSRNYLTVKEGVPLLRERLGPNAGITAVAYDEPIVRNGVRVSLHPAGHLLGACQVRVEHRGEVVVVSGDYKLHADPTCARFEPVRCHTFITESTFALPVYRWPDPVDVVAEINAWWRECQRRRRTSVIFCYAIGKAQRILASVDSSIGSLLVHRSIARFLPAYETAGVRLPPTRTATAESIAAAGGRALVLAPPAAVRSRWLARLGPVSTAAASGWMLLGGPRRRRAVDRGFVLSDHADWDGLLTAIRSTGAENIGAVHGYTDELIRWLRKNGWNAFDAGEQRPPAAGSSKARRRLETPLLPWAET
jgi:putative mRNA 3-end processing factor